MNSQLTILKSCKQMKLSNRVYRFIFLLALTGLAGRTYAQTNVVADNTELAVLKALYDSLGESGWTTKTNWPTPGNWPATATSAQFGTWYGVTVTNGDISTINLSSNGLSGKIPSSISNLSKLSILNFSYNTNISGSIPSSIGSLTN